MCTLCETIIKRPPKSHETVPLVFLFLCSGAHSRPSIHNIPTQFTTAEGKLLFGQRMQLLRELNADNHKQGNIHGKSIT
jgi:hypothetical protein